MFLKKLHRKKNGKGHTYWALVESLRTAKGPRHRVVAYLGELGSQERGGWVSLANRLDGKCLSVVEPTLFDVQEPWDPVPSEATVEIAGVGVTGTKDFGEVWLGLQWWRTLGLDALFQRLFPPGREEVPWDLLACILALGRFCDPSSELHIEDTWYPRTSLPEMLGVGAEPGYVQRLYRTLDMLGPQKAAVEKHRKERWGELFSLDYDRLLYDVTSTYFEGEAKKNPQAKHGHSRDKRSDCRQVCIGLVVTKEGLPLGYEVFDGNRNDVATVEDIVDALEAKYGRAGRIWVLDRGRVNEDNLAYLRERGGHYLVGTPRSGLKRYERELTESGWGSVYEDLEVKLCPSPQGSETFGRCRSADRAKKEKGMQERFSKRIEDGLTKRYRRRSKAKQRPNRSLVERQIGRLLQRNSRAAGKYDIHVTDDPHRKGHVVLEWTCRDDWSDWAALSEGAYLLRTNLNGKTPEDLWHRYIQLADAEAAFRTIKSELVLRPIYHPTAERVQAHILVAFLA